MSEADDDSSPNFTYNATQVKDSTFLGLVADLLRLPESTWLTAHIYYYRYQRFFQTHPEAANSNTLDSHSLSLSCLSLACKATESPRRPREILLPAWRVLHFGSSSSFATLAPAPLSIPSATYDALRATIVQGELVLLRLLKFDIRVPHALDYLPRYLQRAVDRALGDTAGATKEDYDGLPRELKEEYRVVELMDTQLGRACRRDVVEMYKHPCIIFYSPRAIAAAVVFIEACESGLPIPIPQPDDTPSWLKDLTGGKVEWHEDVVGVLHLLCEAIPGRPRSVSNVRSRTPTEQETAERAENAATWYSHGPCTFGLE
ncbi:MAG: hypothetical protein M1816_006217 [Peltula sp. TS41687]|nr:MAG: hypothetical protein M1816_006217 [Peltula sp. TS41687]